MLKEKTGFTLIELLVVVLIIGILSSIALPQYTRAVEKSRAVEAEITLRSLRDAQSRCFLANGKDCTAGCCQGDPDENLFDVMDITLNFPATDNYGGACCGRQGKNFVYSLDGEYIYAERRVGDEELYYFETTALGNNNSIVCYDGTMTCKEVGYTQASNNGWVKP